MLILWLPNLIGWTHRKAVWLRMWCSCVFSEHRNRTNVGVFFFSSQLAGQRLLSPPSPRAAASVMSARLETAACWVMGVCQAAVHTHHREASTVALCDNWISRNGSKLRRTHFSHLMRFYAFDEVVSEHEATWTLSVMCSGNNIVFIQLNPCWFENFAANIDEEKNPQLIVLNSWLKKVLYLWVIVFFSVFFNEKRKWKETNKINKS